ncbi:hypothetical protein PF010_g20508 [Phytophthora fragariae]|uniref:Lebercilin domain-containing protein n=1 Tax=Phytophthora fragariae TaxID=53985 RepID=A0A6A3J9P5_9STRA|nr:hypothetical protein PF011_g18348 [Phytophthora fragariae]KAE9085298.1 hypothetical protein PF010_g20508 [Phytophthora fragariae]KAE9197386.1 hypothetical protein PF004_g19846 [Phytophthora fragariae]
MNRQQVGSEAQQRSPCLGLGEGESEGGIGQLSTEILDDGEEEDGIDLEGYEDYLERLKSKAAVRPCSARVVRPLPTETPLYLMSNGDNPVPTRPARPVSARPRMRTTPRDSSDDRTLNGSQTRASSAGVRRKRQGERLVHARIRAVYNDVGRFSVPVKQVSAPYSVASALNSKSKGVQDAEIHDEYYRLLDAESELKAVCLQEQQRRVKAVAHVRRLEEIIAMKDKKIESLLHAKAVGADRSLSSSKSVVQREMAERDRQFHALAQRLKQKISQQSQLLSSYEEAMQSLRSGIKSTNLTELEEERSQLYQELRHHQELLGRQRLEWEAHQQKLIAFAEAEANNKLQIAKLQQDNKIIAHEKRKLEQEVGFLKSRVELLQSNLNLEQRKRTYDRDFSDSVGKHVSSPPTQKVMLAQALDEMKKLMRRETIASIRREKLKSPKTGTIPPRSDSFASPVMTAPSTAATFSAPKTPSRSTLASPKPPRPSSTASIRSTVTTSRPQTTQKKLKNSDPATKVGVIAETSSPAANASQTSNCQDQDKQVNVHSGAERGQSGTKPADSAEQATRDGVQISQQEMQERIEDEGSNPTCPPSNPEPDPGGGQNSFGGDASQTTDQIADEDMEVMQQQTLAAVQSVLRFDVDDEFDSELSADLLDDAQHPMLRSDTGLAIEMADAALDIVASNAEAGITVEEGPREDPSLDDLYPSDFLDTDVQASMEDEEESDAKEDI